MSKALIVLIIVLLVFVFTLLAADSQNLAIVRGPIINVPNFGDSCSDIKDAVVIIKRDEIQVFNKVWRKRYEI